MSSDAIITALSLLLVITLLWNNYDIETLVDDVFVL